MQTRSVEMTEGYTEDALSQGYVINLILSPIASPARALSSPQFSPLPPEMTSQSKSVNVAENKAQQRRSLGQEPFSTALLMCPVSLTCCVTPLFSLPASWAGPAAL